MSDIKYSDIQMLDNFGQTANSDIGHLVAIEERYSGYLKRENEERNNLDPIVQKKNNIPYLVDQHLLDKKNA